MAQSAQVKVHHLKMVPGRYVNFSLVDLSMGGENRTNPCLESAELSFALTFSVDFS